MMGLILVGLLGVVIVAVGAPLVTWALWMETLREQASRRAEIRTEAEPPRSCRPFRRSVITAVARCNDHCRPVARASTELDEPLSVRGATLVAV